MFLAFMRQIIVALIGVLGYSKLSDFTGRFGNVFRITGVLVLMVLGFTRRALLNR